MCRDYGCRKVVNTTGVETASQNKCSGALRAATNLDGPARTSVRRHNNGRGQQKIIIDIAGVKH